MIPRPSTAYLTACVLAGCGFHPGVEAINSDGQTSGDAPVDTAAGTPASCAAIHTASPAEPSGNYSIDPDGDGGDAPFTVTCDMSTAGGGWTVIYLADVNVLTTPIAYQTASGRLLEDAQATMLAYRDAARVVVSGTSYATFPMLAQWRVDSPFDYPGNDSAAMVSVDDGVPAQKTVRYGYQSFSAVCGDAWITTASAYGRLCIENTDAPFYVGFATPVDDNCSDSASRWDKTACDGDIRLSIAVR